MITSVPQFIDVEDKIAGPFTWRQLGWMVGMGAALFLLYNMASRGAFFLLAIPTIMLFFALAFYRPNGMSLARFIFYGVGFLFRPKEAVWERPVEQLSMTSHAQKENIVEEVASGQKRISPEEIARLARSVDREGL